MKKTQIITAIIVIVAILGVWYITASKQAISSEKVVFGAIAPLTGQISVLGEHMRNGMELARQEVVASGQIKDFSINYQDACDAKSSLNAAQQLVNADHVKVISSAFCLFGEDAVVPIAENSKVIFFNTAANPESVLNKKYVFSTNFTIRNDSETLANFVTDKLHAKTVAIVHLASSFGESYKDNFTKSFEARGGKVVLTEKKAPDATEFRTEMTKIKALNPDVVIIIHFGVSFGNAVKQAREIGIKSTLVGDYESEDPTVLEYAGAAAEGLIFSSSQPAIRNDKVMSFEQKYQKAYGELPDVLASNAYDAIHLQADAYVACAGNTDCMSENLSNVRNYDGVSGSITIDPKDHSVTKLNVFKIVKNEKFAEYK